MEQSASASEAFRSGRSDASTLDHHCRHHALLDVVEVANDLNSDTLLHHDKLPRRPTIEKFEARLVAAIQEWLSIRGEKDRELRLTIMTPDAYLVPVAVKHGFDFLSANPGQVVMTLHQRCKFLSRTSLDLEITVREWEEGLLRPLTLNLPTRAHRIHPKRVLMLYNPFAGSKQGQVIANHAFELLTAAGIAVHLIQLQRPGHATEICSTTNLGEYDCVAAVGGDGTLHECIQGVMSRTGDPHPIVVAPIPAGTGNSFVRELHGDVTWNNSAQRIVRGLHAPIDLMKVTCTGTCCKKAVTWSFNSLHWGLGAQVNVAAEKMRWLGSAVRYSAAAIFQVFFGGRQHVAVSLEDQHGSKIEYNEKFCVVIVNNIQGAAKGMVIAPDARLNDGVVDVLLVRSDAPHDLVKLFEGFYRKLPFVEYRQVRRISMVSEKPRDDEVLDIDGELKHCTSFATEVCGGALRVIV